MRFSSLFCPFYARSGKLCDVHPFSPIYAFLVRFLHHFHPFLYLYMRFSNFFWPFYALFYLAELSWGDNINFPKSVQCCPYICVFGWKSDRFLHIFLSFCPNFLLYMHFLTVFWMFFHLFCIILSTLRTVLSHKYACYDGKHHFCSSFYLVSWNLRSRC